MIETEQPDLLYLAEYKQLDIEAFKTNLQSLNYQIIPNPGCNKILIISSRTVDDINLTLQQNDYSGIYLKRTDINIIALHMPSQYSYDFDALKYNISEFKSDFEQYIGKSSNTNIILIGDFNVNPFEKPMVNYDGLAATNSVNFNSKRTFRGKQKEVYYNPTWKLYAKTYFPGSFYRKRPSNSSFDVIEHHFLDQVVLSEKFLKKIKVDHIDLIEETKNYTIFDSSSYNINYSDHLPIKYEYTL